MQSQGENSSSSSGSLGRGLILHMAELGEGRGGVMGLREDDFVVSRKELGPCSSEMVKIFVTLVFFLLLPDCFGRDNCFCFTFQMLLPEF